MSPSFCAICLVTFFHSLKRFIKIQISSIVGDKVCRTGYKDPFTTPPCVTRIDPCSSTTCQNGGIPHATSDGTCECHCSQPFTGKYENEMVINRVTKSACKYRFLCNLPERFGKKKTYESQIWSVCIAKRRNVVKWNRRDVTDTSGLYYYPFNFVIFTHYVIRNLLPNLGFA